MKSRIPLALIFSRLLMGLVIVLISITQPPNYKAWSITLLSAGLLTDIFDGIIARKMNVSTQRLRRLDSSIDQIFFLAVLAASYIQCPDFFKGNALKLIVILGVEASTYVISFIRFKKEVATHSIGAKFWTLLLFATLVQIIWQCQSIMLFNICFWVGLLTRFEIVAIILTLKSWTNDVPTLYHAIQLRKGKEIRRHKLFNG